MALIRDYQRRLKLTRRSLLGIGISVLATLILAVLGLFFWQKYTAPAPLAKLLPAEKTLFFIDLRFNEKEPELKKFFQTYATTDLLNLNSLGLQNISTLLDQVNSRAGIAFFGPEPDPNKFALFLDVKNTLATFDFLQKQSLDKEKVLRQYFLGHEFYIYPRGFNLAFTFYRDDLILASSDTELKLILAAIKKTNPRVADEGSYHAIINRLDPSSKSFAYFSETFLTKALNAKLANTPYVLALPLLGSWQSAGLNLTASTEALRFDFRFLLKNQLVRSKIFTTGALADTTFLKTLGPDTKNFYLASNTHDPIEHFIKTLDKDYPNYALVAEGSLNRLTKLWLGNAVDFGTDIAPLFAGPSLLAQTNNNQPLLVLGTDKLASFQELLKKIQGSNGRLVARTRTTILPDESNGRDLVAAPEKITSRTKTETEVNWSQLKFAENEIDYATIDPYLVIANNETVLEKALGQISGNSSGYEALVKQSGLTGNLLYFQKIDAGTSSPLLSPFKYILIGTRIGVDGVQVEIFLGK